MPAALTTNSGDFEVVTLPDPTPGPDELVVRVAACGVCGSDIKARPYMLPGTVMGHEIGGDVVAAGASAKAAGWNEGATVAVLPAMTCGQCDWCARGYAAHCSSVRFLGMGAAPGGFAEYAVVTPGHAFRLPPEVPATFAPLVEPFAVGLHAVASAAIGPGDKVLVIGAGGVGLTALAWARVKGAERVIVVDPDPARRTLAGKLGATETLASTADADVGTYDAVVECVGRPELVEAAALAAGARGRIVIAGACEQPVSIEPISALLKELTLRFSVGYQASEFQTVIDAFATRAIDPALVVGPTLGLDRIGDAFELVRTAGVEGRVLVSAGQQGLNR